MVHVTSSAIKVVLSGDTDLDVMAAITNGSTLNEYFSSTAGLHRSLTGFHEQAITIQRNP